MFSWIATADDSIASELVHMDWNRYPGVIDATDGVLKANYSEKLNVGYRYYAAKNLSAKFPFGHGALPSEPNVLGLS